MLETAAYISDLNSAQPPAGDPAKQGYAHLNLIKGVLKNTFPNANGQVTATVAHLNNPLLSTERPAVPQNGAAQTFAIPYYTSNTTAGTANVTSYGLTLLGLANAAALSQTLNLDAYFLKAGGTMTGPLSVPSITIANVVTITAEAGNPVFSFPGGKMTFDATAKTYTFASGSKKVVFNANADISAAGNVTAGASL